MLKISLFPLLLANISTSIVSANNFCNQLEVPLPTTFMKLKVIDNITYLYGLIDISMAPTIESYNTITITNNINVIEAINSSYSDKRLDSITKINYHENSNLTRISSGAISCLQNLAEIYFPSSLNYIGKDAILCCPNLKVLDFSKIEKDESFISPLIFEKSIPTDISSTGKVYVKNEQIKKSTEIKFHNCEIFSNWNVVVK